MVSSSQAFDLPRPGLGLVWDMDFVPKGRKEEEKLQNLLEKAFLLLVGFCGL